MIDNLHGYRDLRALVEELVSATDPQPFLTALRIWLRLHCAECGAVIIAPLRSDDPPQILCLDCIAPSFPPPPPHHAPEQGRSSRPQGGNADSIPF